MNKMRKGDVIVVMADSEAFCAVGLLPKPRTLTPESLNLTLRVLGLGKP